MFAGSADGYVSRGWGVICKLFAFFLLILYVCSPILPDFYQSLPATRTFYFLGVQLSFCLVCLLFSFFFFCNGKIHEKIRWDMVCILCIHWFGIRIWCLCPFVLLLPWNKAHFSESAKYFKIFLLQLTCRIGFFSCYFFFVLVNYNLGFVCSSLQFKSLTLGSWQSLLH